jgi:hypothetical protein
MNQSTTSVLPRIILIIALFALGALALFIFYNSGFSIYIAYVRNEFYHPLNSSETTLDRAFGPQGLAFLRFAARSGWVPLTLFVVLQCITAYVVSTMLRFKSSGFARRYASGLGLTVALTLIVWATISTLFTRLLGIK